MIRNHVVGGNTSAKASAQLNAVSVVFFRHLYLDGAHLRCNRRVLVLGRANWIVISIRSVPDSRDGQIILVHIERFVEAYGGRAAAVVTIDGIARPPVHGRGGAASR